MLSNRLVTCGMNIFNCSICISNLSVASGSPLLSKATWFDAELELSEWSDDCEGKGVLGLDDVEPAEEDLSDVVVDWSRS